MRRAYYGGNAVTAKVAGNLAKAVGGDLYEIAPEVPYTKADLNWMDKESRSSVEMGDKSSRPAIATKVDNMEQYDVVFVGFPIWWYREPSIIDTFMENYDFTGKTVVPFATSGGSGLGDSCKNMQELSPGATVKDGRKFAPSASEASLKEWAEQFI